MYQQGDRRQAASGSRAGESFWQEEAGNFGMKMMKQMGWEQGKGLGKNEDGQKQYLKAKYKADARGIGAKADQVDATWTATQDLYTDMLKRLKSDNASSPTDSPSPVEESVEVSETTTSTTDGKTNTTTTLKNYIAKRTLYGRFKRSKDVSNYSSTAMSEIFGRKPTTPTPAAAASSASSKEAKPVVKQEAPEDQLLQTSKLSIRDYFANKLAAAGKLGSMSAKEFASGGSGPGRSSVPDEPVVKREEEEQPRGFTMNQQEDYYNRMMNCAISGAGVQTGMRAKVGLGFGGAGMGGNVSGGLGYKPPTSTLYHAKKSIKLEADTPESTAAKAAKAKELDEAEQGSNASSPVASFEEEAQEAAAVDAVPHGSVGHDEAEAKQRRKLARKEEKKKLKQEALEEASKEMHRSNASSPVASLEEDAIELAAVDAAPHGSVGHDSEEAKLRKKMEKKAEKKRKRAEEEAAAAKGNDDSSDDDEARAAKKAKKKAKKEAEAAAAEAARLEAEEAERKKAKKEKKKEKKESSADVEMEDASEKKKSKKKKDKE